MILPCKLPDLLLLFREEFRNVRCTLHMMALSVGRHERIMLLGAERLQIFLPLNDILTRIDFPYAMVKTNAIGASVTQQVGISCAVLRIAHIPVTIHLKPVNVGLIRQTANIADGRKDNHSLLELVKAELHMIIDHTIIADSAIIHICIAFVIWNVLPQCG